MKKRDTREHDNANDATRIIKGMIEDEELHKTNEAGVCMQRIKIGLFQDDLILVKRYLDRKSSITVSSNSKISMHVGSALIQMKDFKFEQRNKILSKIILSFFWK